MDDSWELLDIQTINIRKLRVAGLMSDEFHSDLPYNVRSSVERDVERVLLRKVLELAMGCEAVHEVSVEYPSSAWQHIKQDFAPQWFKNKFPVKYTTKTLCAEVCYPFINHELDPDAWAHTFLRSEGV